MIFNTLHADSNVTGDVNASSELNTTTTSTDTNVSSDANVSNESNTTSTDTNASSKTSGNDDMSKIKMKLNQKFNSGEKISSYKMNNKKDGNLKYKEEIRAPQHKEEVLNDGIGKFIGDR